MIEIIMDGSSFYECPKCGNDEIEIGDNYCTICGEAIEWKED